MSKDDFRAYVESRFLTEFSSGYPDMPVDIANTNFVQPDDGDWCCVKFKDGKSFQASIGLGKFVERTPGFVQIDCVTKFGKGTAEVLKRADFCADIFAYRKDRYNSITVTFHEKRVEEAPAGKEFFRMMVTVFYYYDVFRDKPQPNL